jgi:hypothetical protein
MLVRVIHFGQGEPMTDSISPKSSLDGLVNVVSGLGTNKSKRSANMWVYDLLNNYQQLDSAYQTDWIARKVVDIPAKDMTREWRRIKSEFAEEITAVEQEFCLPNVVQEALTWAGLFGGAGILMLTGQDLSKPMNINRVKKGSLQQLLVFDRWDLSPLTINTWDILSPNYLMPEFYTIRNGGQQIHWSHIVRFHGERLPRRWMEHTQGWGDSKLRKCIADIGDMVAAKGGIAELMQEANIDVINREGLSEELASDQDELIIQRYEAFSQMKSIINMALLDGDETYDRKTLSLSGVSPILEVFMTWISGAADIPLTRMFGTSAKGMNATGEGDDKNYNNSIRSQQLLLMSPMRVLDEVFVRSAIGHWPDDYDYIWNPLAQANDLENAQAEQLRAQKHQMYLEMGVVKKSQIMLELQANEEYQYNEEELDDLIELEDGNMFETLPEIGGESEPLPEDDLSESPDEQFVDAYQRLTADGMTHDEVMAELSHANI